MHVEPATPQMFDGIYALLKNFDAQRMSRDDWRAMLFGHGWRAPEDPYGYVLLDGTRPRGFIGTLYSRQMLGGQEQRCCNLSSWIVEDDCRLQALRLLGAALADKEAVFTGLTLIGATSKIFRKRGFRELETEAVVLSPLSSLLRPRGLRSLSIATHPHEIRPHLTGGDRSIFESHAHARCSHVLLRWRDAQCYVVSTRWRLKRQAVSHIHHVSDNEVFWSRLAAVQWALWRTQKTPFVMVDKRHVRDPSVPVALHHRLRQPRLYRPPAGRDLPPHDVGALYSELMWLRV